MLQDPIRAKAFYCMFNLKKEAPRMNDFKASMGTPKKQTQGGQYLNIKATRFSALTALKTRRKLQFFSQFFFWLAIHKLKIYILKTQRHALMEREAHNDLFGLLITQWTHCAATLGGLSQVPVMHPLKS
jgi:hypothetical protein